LVRNWPALKRTAAAIIVLRCSDVCGDRDRRKAHQVELIGCAHLGFERRAILER
jgi:hypothetical protein